MKLKRFNESVESKDLSYYKDYLTASGLNSDSKYIVRASKDVLSEIDLTIKLNTEYKADGKGTWKKNRYEKCLSKCKDIFNKCESYEKVEDRLVSEEVRDFEIDVDDDLMFVSLNIDRDNKSEVLKNISRLNLALGKLKIKISDFQWEEKWFTVEIDINQI